jgi:hypothetical protein
VGPSPPSHHRGHRAGHHDQVRELVGRLGDSLVTPVFAFDAGYDPTALTHELADVAATLVVRIRDDRIFYTDPDIETCWRAYLRRFDIEHTYRFVKNTRGWTAPSVRTPEQPTGGPG